MCIPSQISTLVGSTAPSHPTKRHVGGARCGAVGVLAIANHEAALGSDTEELRRRQVSIGRRLQSARAARFTTSDDDVKQTRLTQRLELAGRWVIADQRDASARG